MSDPQTPPAEPTKAHIVNPPNFLKQKTKLAPGKLEDFLASADGLVGSLHDEFEAGCEVKIKQLVEIFSKRWQSAATRAQAVLEMRSLSHSLKGEAGTFGYPLITEIGDHFSDYLRETKTEAQKPEAIKSYIDAFQVVWSRRIKGDGGEIGRQLIASLMKLNEKAGVKVS